ncbi:MAG: DUF4910 domain-containing protein [Pseudomonadota bacterium]
MKNSPHSVHPATSPSVEGDAIYEFMETLFDLPRSITGDGNRMTLNAIGEHVPIQTFEIPTGTAVFDWTVPKEWRVNAAYIADSTGRKIVDIENSNLHLMSYSTAVDAYFTWEELEPHLYTVHEFDDAVPYRTSYFTPSWGFCVKRQQYRDMKARSGERFKVFVDADHFDGSLSYGEVLVPGASNEEIIVSTHICHPALANDNVSGIAVSAFLAKTLLQSKCHYSFRFVFVPATIGSITWLAKNENQLNKIKGGYSIGLLGDSGHIHYKQSRHATSEFDRAADLILQQSGDDHDIRPFVPWGHDERQYCSPGINLPVGCVMRTPYGEYPQYHTSADNMDIVCPQSLQDSYDKVLAMLHAVDANAVFKTVLNGAEPFLAPHNLYEGYSRDAGRDAFHKAVLWMLSCADGEQDLLSIAQRSGLSVGTLRRAANTLREKNLLEMIQGIEQAC